ncbi:hypothetical protein ACLKA7_017501 [Drosophila subpalustris]
MKVGVALKWTSKVKDFCHELSGNEPQCAVDVDVEADAAVTVEDAGLVRCEREGGQKQVGEGWARWQHQRPTQASAIRSHLTKVSTTQRHPIAFNFRRRECKRFYVLPVYMHSTKQNCRLWWQYAFKCVTRNSNNNNNDAIWNPNLKFQLHCKRQLRIRKLRRVTWSNREPLRLHITDIELICHLRKYSK